MNDAADSSGVLSPAGLPLTGTLERFPGVALARFVRENERLRFDYTGQREIWWDRVRTATFRGGPLFADEAQNVFTEAEIVQGETLHEERDPVRTASNEVIEACDAALARLSGLPAAVELAADIERAKDAAFRLLMEYEGI